MKSRKITKVMVALCTGAMMLTACGDSEAVDDKSVHIVYTPFDEGIAATFLWQHILETEGYDVELTLMDPGPAYAGVSQDDADLYLAANPGTHSDYWDEYSDGFESIGVWYEPLRHALAVPDYVHDEGIETIDDLAGRADEFGNQIVGIESGAGIMREAQEATEIYDLDGYDLLESSTAAMLADFGAAIENDEWIVATAWNPHWAVGEYDLELLDDPEGIFSDGDTYEVIASESAQNNSDLMDLLSEFEMNDDELFSLLGEVRDADDGNEDSAVEAWLEEDEHQDLIDKWVSDANVD